VRLRAIAEASILVIFLASALVVILGLNIAVPTDVEDSESAEEYVRRGDRIYAAGRSKFNEASIQYWEAIKRDPAAVDAHFKLATIYYEYIWNHEVLRELGEVERIDPNYPGLYLLLGKVYHRIGDADRASEAFQRAVTLQPGSSEAHYYMGTVYEQRNMRREAISEYEKAVETGSDDTAVLKAHLQLGRIYKKERKREKAEDELREALSIDPASAEVISELRGLYRQEAEDYEYRDEHGKAAEKYEGILEIDPDNPRNVEIYMKLGNIYRSDELYDKATAMYEAATKLDPLNYDAFSALKELELLRNNDSEKE
jgi:tetratricopeptide (TPR) repeat protein